MSENEERKPAAVPKFSSFKTKPKAITATEHKPGDRGQEKSVTAGEAAPPREKRSHRSKHRPQHSRQHHRPHDSDRSRSKSPDSGSGRQIVKRAREVATVPQPEPPVSSCFVIDTKGDPLLNRYGADRWNAPQFRREWREPVLGSDGFLVIHRDEVHEKFSIRRPGDGSGPSLRDKNPFRRTRQVKPTTFRIKKGQQPDDTALEDFISLTSGKRKRADDGESSADENRRAYRSIEGKAKAHEFSDSDIEYGSDSSSHPSGGGSVTEEDPLKQKSIVLSRRVKADPGDMPAWLELIDHQDTLMKAGADPAQEVSTNEIKSFAEIKISMYEKALPHAKGLRDRERLLVGLVREGSKIWSEKTLAKRWETLAKDTDESSFLWGAYLEYQLGNLATFDCDRIKKIFLDRIASLLTRARDQAPSQPLDRLRDLYRELIHVFLTTTRFLYDAGYSELSVAAWQALLEVNFMGQGQVVAQDLVPEAFREFWEAEVPRIGETGAHGWGHYAESSGDDAPEPRTAEDEALGPESRDGYKNWAWQELRRGKAARIPARTLDDGTDDDQFRIVMYSDLEGIPFVIPANVLPLVKADVFDAFLIFCRLPPLHLSSDWIADPFLAPGDKGFEMRVSRPPSSALETEDSKPPPDCVSGRITPAVVPEYIASLLQWGECYRDHHKPVDFTWVLLTLKQLVQHGAEELGMYYLALEWLRDAGSIKKAAKPLIKKYPSNLEFYNLYGVFEWANGNSDVSRNVLSAATRLKPPSSSAAMPTLLVWLTLAWNEFVNGTPSLHAISSLCSSVGTAVAPDDMSSTHILKAREAFMSGSGQLLLSHDWDGSVISAKCLALLEYMTTSGGSEPQSENQGNISAAMDVVWRHSDGLASRGQSGSPTQRALLNFAATLLYLHTTRGPHRRSFLCNNVKKAIQLFPRSTTFLSLFSWADSTLRLRSDFHILLEDYVLVGTTDCVPLRICAITRELDCGTVYSVRAAFEKALASEAARSSAPLWIAYIRFSHSRKELRSKAKEVYYRALTRCPWSKEVVMEGFTTLARDMESGELKGAWRGMGGKGLRVHIDLEEFLERNKRADREKRGKDRKDRR